MYILLKNTNYLPFVNEFLIDSGCKINCINTVRVDDFLAKYIYNNMNDIHHLQNAINSINNKLCIIIQFEHNTFTIEECKKYLQGSFNTDDINTIRGFLKKINYDITDNSYVHIPDTKEKMDLDIIQMYPYFT